jgi:uncharacterized membrane protein YphA (DoxX/SURF4 family)
MTSRTNFSTNILRLLLGSFFIVLGICEIFPNTSTGIFSLRSGNPTLETIFGITEIICGLLVLLGFFLFSNQKGIFWGGFIVLIFWIARIVLSKFIWGFDFMYNGNINIPAFFSWLLYLLCETIIAAALLMTVKEYN